MNVYKSFFWNGGDVEWKSEVVYDWIILFVKLFPLHFLEGEETY